MALPVFHSISDLSCTTVCACTHVHVRVSISEYKTCDVLPLFSIAAQWTALHASQHKAHWFESGRGHSLWSLVSGFLQQSKDILLV